MRLARSRPSRGQDVPLGKPAPDLFLRAAAAMGAQPAGCVVVEDTASGVTAAVAAGMRVFGFAVDADADAAALSAAGAELVYALDELPGLLGLG
jgi:beta-phosphoglucomutase-like phosphatase (HAD superfamily)